MRTSLSSGESRRSTNQRDLNAFSDDSALLRGGLLHTHASLLGAITHAAAYLSRYPSSSTVRSAAAIDVEICKRAIILLNVLANAR